MHPPAERLKPCRGESNNIACLAMFKSLTEKHCTITWSFLMIQSVSFINAAFEAFVKTYLCLLVSASAKKVIKFLGILKKYVFENKIYFCSRKKSNVSLNQKVIFVFQTIFKLDFIMQIICCVIHRCLCFHFILFCSLISVSKRWNIETMLTFSHSYNWQKFNNKMNENRSQEYQSFGPEYVTGQINSCILEFLLRWFCCLIFAPS